jgi:gluconate 5-dehydrogenase
MSEAAMNQARGGFELFSLRGQVFVITGASSGIGLAIARAMAAVGATVGLNSRNRANLEKAAATVPGGFIVPFDVADHAAAARALEQTIADHGRLDGVVCNAGARDRRAFFELAPEDFRALLDTNLVAPFQFAQIAARHLVKQGHGRIIFLTSLAANQSRPGDPGYAGTKSGINGLMRGLAVDLGPYNVTVNAIAPGAIATEMNMPLVSDREKSAEFTRQAPLGRWGTPDEVAGAAVFLASEAGRYVTGHVLTVDGGASVKIYG